MSDEKLTSKVEGEFDEPKKVTRKKVIVTDTKVGEPWTIDVRKAGGFNEKYLDEIGKKLNSEGKYIHIIYCSDVQAEMIQGFEKYKDVILTIEP